MLYSNPPFVVREFFFFFLLVLSELLADAWGVSYPRLCST